MAIELNDKENIDLIKEGLKDYQDGALEEAAAELGLVVKRIEDFIIGYEACDGGA